MRYQRRPYLLHSRRAARFGFTLAEMLIVIAIIALLAALLFPVLERAKQGAQRTVCLNNMKQMGLAFQQYLSDYDQHYPGAGQFEKWGNGGHWVKGTNNAILPGPPPTVANDGQDGALFLASDPEKRTGNVADVQGGALYPYVKSTKLYVCPSDPYGDDDKGLSYSMNCAIGGMSNRARMKNPTDITLLVDEGYGNDGFFYAVNSVGSTDSLAQFHLNSGNILFCDGHVRGYAYATYPLSKDNGPLKVQMTGVPRFYDPAFDTTGSADGIQGFYNPVGGLFGTCEAP